MILWTEHRAMDGKNQLHIGIKPNERCYDVEYLGYVIGTLVFGMFLFICCIFRQILYFKMFSHLPEASELKPKPNGRYIEGDKWNLFNKYFQGNLFLCVY